MYWTRFFIASIMHFSINYSGLVRLTSFLLSWMTLKVLLSALVIACSQADAKSSRRSSGILRRFLVARALPQNSSSWPLIVESPMSLVSKASSSSFNTAKLLKVEIGKNALAVGRESYLTGAKTADGSERCKKKEEEDEGREQNKTN